MRIAIPVWKNRVSPVMDTAQRLSVIDVEGKKEVCRDIQDLKETFLPRRAHFLADQGVDVLICGAISRPFCECLRVWGIGIVPWVAGTIDEVARAYLEGQLGDPHFLMPGCRRGRTGGGFGRGKSRCPR